MSARANAEGHAMINVIHCEAPDELYCHFAGQSEMQPAYVCIDPVRADLAASYNTLIGDAVPADVFQGLVLRYPIPVLTMDAVNRLLDEIKPLAERVQAGWTRVRSESGWRGELNTDATNAEEKIIALCTERFNDSDKVGEEDAADWFASDDDASLIAYFGISAETTDAELGEFARATVLNSVSSGSYGYTVLTGAYTAFADLRDTLRE